MKHLQTTVNSFRTFVVDRNFLAIIQSLKKPVQSATINMTAYGSAEYKPFSLIENFSTSLMYFGRSDTIMKKPQL